jgi:hypothetical protein
VSVRTFTGQQSNIASQPTYSGHHVNAPGRRAQRRSEAHKFKSCGPVRRNLASMRPIIFGLLLIVGVMLAGSLIGLVTG